MTDQQRVMSTLKYTFLVSFLLFIVVATKIPSKAQHPPQKAIELAIIVLALMNLVLGMNGRRLFARITARNVVTPKGTGLSTPTGQWFTANIFRLAMIESCALFALVLHLLGSSTKLVGILFACAILTLIFWSPGSPPAPDNASGVSH